ncbi:hypothetical protein ABZ930_30425 [Streptomyces sp. NPDC046716]|uniref:hypothetical protein n=1 Tax=Streptomyces sp. NPDC046716 TaxID=3157093 RepID=UPI0033F4CF4D
MPTDTKRLVASLSLAFPLSLCLLAGCGGQSGDEGRSHRSSPQSAREQEARARQVADAWRGSTPADTWRQGYHPMADVVQAPKSGWHSKGDEQAYETRNFVLRGALPADGPEQGKVDWGDGKSLNRPLTRSKEAYRSFALNHSDGPLLTVTGARLGTTTIETSRGTAIVPAWLFTLRGYDAPLKRVAVAASKLPESPIGQVGQGTAGGLRGVRLGGPAVEGRSVAVRATHGACDDGPVVKVLETDDDVVLYASVAGPKSGACSAEMIEKNMKVELRRPLADRVLLDALTGRPVPYAPQNGPSPSWT